MEPWDDLSSTGYALANLGEEYLVLQPSDRGSFTVELEPGTYSAEWFSIEGRERIPGEETTVESPAGHELQRAVGGVQPSRPVPEKVGR